MITLVNYKVLNTEKARCDFGCDTSADVANLPTTGDLEAYGLKTLKAAPWSMAVVAADKSMYYFDSAKWTKIGG